MTLTVAALQLPHRHGDLAGQLAAADRLLGTLAGVDLAVLPEMALTGYVSARGDFDLRPFAEPLDGPTCAQLAALARRHELALAGPLVERDGARCYNACVVFDAAGRRLAHYRKRHPSIPERWATPGELALPLFEVAGAQVTIAICYDVHFLERESARQLDAADLLLFPSAWVELEGDQRDQLLPELARGHQLAIVNANWGRGVPEVPGQGASRLVDASGRELARLGTGEDVLVGQLLG